MGRLRKSAQVQVRDTFRPMTEYCVDPLTITAVGLKLGEVVMEKARLRAKERGLGEFAVIGECGIHVALRPPAEAWPPEPWMHEFVKPKYLAQARSIIND